MSSTLTQLINSCENNLKANFEPQAQEGLKRLGCEVIYRLISGSSEVFKVGTIAIDILVGLRAAPSSLLNFGLNKKLYKGVVKQLKEGDKLIPTACLIIIKPIFTPSFNLQSLSFNTAFKKQDFNWSKSLRTAGKKWSIECCQSNEIALKGIFIRQVMSRLGFVCTYAGSVVLRIIQVVQGALYLIGSLGAQNREEYFKKSMIALSGAGLLNDLFKGGVRFLNPNAGINSHAIELQPKPEQSIEEQSVIQKKFTESTLKTILSVCEDARKDNPGLPQLFEGLEIFHEEIRDIEVVKDVRGQLNNFLIKLFTTKDINYEILRKDLKDSLAK